MGFWGQVENVAVNGVAGVAGAIGATGIPAVSQIADGVATGVHAIDAAGHGIAAGYDAITGDDEAYEHNMEMAETQGVDAAVAGAGLLANTLAPGTPIAEFAEGVSAGGAAADLAHVATSFGPQGIEGASPTAGEAIVGLGGKLWDAL